MPTKQVILIRSDLKMRRGKECSQVGHASGAWMADMLLEQDRYGGRSFLSREQYDWLMNDATTKIVLKCTSEADLLRVYSMARKQGLTAILVKDKGRTEVPAGTITALSIGPHDESKFEGLTDGFTPY